MEIKLIHKEEVWKLRHEVMWPEREPDYIKLADDDQGKHYGLYVGDRLVSVLSLFVNGTEGQFRKFATLELEQGQGYGSKLLNTVLAEAEQAGCGGYSVMPEPTRQAFIRNSACRERMKCSAKAARIMWSWRSSSGLQRIRKGELKG